MFERLDFSRIPVFLSAAEHLNFTEAANELYMTQSSLSKSIASFEAAIGFPLFERGNRKVTLTPEGEYLYRELSRIMTETKAVVQTANQIRDGQAGGFRIGVSGYLPKNPVFSRLNSQFSIDCPSYDIELCTMAYPEMRRALLDTKVDAILFNQHDLSAMKGFHILTLSRGEAILLCNPNIELPRPERELTLRDFKDHRFVSMDPDTSRSYYEYLMNCCQLHGFVPNIVRYTQTLVDVINYVTNLNYVTVLDRALFPPQPIDLRVIPIPSRPGMTILDTVLAWKDGGTNQAFRRYIAYAEELLGRKAAIL